MSRIGKEPVAIPAGVTVTVDGQKVTVKGKLGELSYVMHDGVAAKVEGGYPRLDGKRFNMSYTPDKLLEKDEKRQVITLKEPEMI